MDVLTYILDMGHVTAAVGKEQLKKISSADEVEKVGELLKKSTKSDVKRHETDSSTDSEKNKQKQNLRQF